MTDSKEHTHPVTHVSSCERTVREREGGREGDSRRMAGILGGSCSVDSEAVTLLHLEDEPKFLFKSSELIRSSFCDFAQTS
jgi:hypothetical protein